MVDAAENRERHDPDGADAPAGGPPVPAEANPDPVLCEGVYDLPRDDPEAPLPADPDGDDFDSLPESILLDNVRWFCRVRWVIATVLTVAGIVGAVPVVFTRFSLLPRPLWPFIAAGLLALENVVNARLLARWQQRGRTHAGRLALWSQIIIDLLVLTYVIHHGGTRETSLHLIYLFHIALACIFFSPRDSFSVLILACMLFTGCILAEDFGLISPAGLFVDSATRAEPYLSSPFWHMNMVATQLIWAAVWYLVSHLAGLVRSRDRELATTNRQLVAARDAKAGHILRTTHELKAPFAAIHANTQLLTKGHCGTLPEPAREVVLKISARARRLAREIQDMLQLANLSAPDQEKPPHTPRDLVPILAWCMQQTEALAQEKSIRVRGSGPGENVIVRGCEEHLKMLFSNLLTNAITYSLQGGSVAVEWGYADTPDGSRVRVSVADTGIGIPAEKLPHIFDDYYRTDEAVRHCKESTGLGLAIVRRVALDHGIRIRVRSRPGKGTRVELTFPAESPGAPGHGRVPTPKRGAMLPRGL